jgi:hypothetical protein
VLLAVARIPDGVEARAQAAAAAGLALADLNRRLAGPLPRVLIPAAPDERAHALAQALEGLGFLVLTCDVAAVPGDDDRVVARRVELAADALVVSDGQGRTHRCPRGAVALLQRGVRHSRTEERVKTSERRFSVGKAVLSGGMMLTKKIEKTEVATVETAEPFLLVGRGDGEPDIILYERRLDYRSMGPEMQPSSRGNLERLWAWLQALAPGRTDDRVARPGFVSGLPATAADPIDLALYLVALTHRASPSGG